MSEIPSAPAVSIQEFCAGLSAAKARWETEVREALDTANSEFKKRLDALNADPAHPPEDFYLKDLSFLVANAVAENLKDIGWQVELSGGGRDMYQVIVNVKPTIVAYLLRTWRPGVKPLTETIDSDI